MNNKALTSTNPHSVRLAALAEPETRHLIETGQRYGWDFNVLGIAPVPEGPVRIADWLITPAHLDSSPMPEHAMERIKTLFAEGDRPVAFVLAHEAPMLLTASQGETEIAVEGEDIIAFSGRKTLRERFTPKTTAGTLGLIALGVVALPAVAAMAIVALAGIAMLLTPLLVVGGALSLDPILIAVTSEGYWVEIDRWDIEVS